MNKKLRKALLSEVDELFTIFVNGELQLTKDEVKDYIDELEGCDSIVIKEMRLRLQKQLCAICEDESPIGPL